MADRALPVLLMDRTALARVVEASPYAAALGVRVEHVDAGGARLRLPYADANSNPGQVLHGGAIASVIDIVGVLAARAALGVPLEWGVGTLDLSVNYLAAAIGVDIVATAEVLRRGKEIVYSAVDVRTDADKRIAYGLATARAVDPAAGPRAAERQRWTPAVPGGGAVAKIPGADAFVMAPFMRRLGITVEHAHDAAATLVLPCGADRVDADGALHEGALAALIDTTGALAAWSLTGLDMRFKASTVGLHASFHGRVVGADAVAQASTLRRDNEIFLNHVRVGAGSNGTVVATGSVTYRIVIP